MTGLAPATREKAPRPPRDPFRTFGCKLNLYESSGMGQAIHGRGFVVQDGDADADVVVVNTCSVTARADQEARQYVRSLHRRNPAARIVVTGCYAQRAPAELAALPGVAVVAGHAEKDRLAGLLASIPDPGAPPLVEVGNLAGKTMTRLRATGAEGRTRALLRVQDGCDSPCTYCVIPATRGRSRSLPLDEAVGEARRLLDAGYRELVLTGTHLGHYGIDARPRARLSGLVEAILALPAPHAFRLRLSSVEPQEIDERLVGLFASRRELSGHVHLPLQSGSDPVLRAMRRSYRTAAYRARVRRLAAAVRPLALGADLIAGFPGETEEDFRRTLAFLAELPFTHLHAFPFSPRPGTAAAGLPGRPSGEMTQRRLAAARALVAAKQLAFRRDLVGGDARVLVESDAPDGTAEGFSDHYLRVRFPAPRPLQGRFALVRLLAVTEHGMDGALLEAIP